MKKTALPLRSWVSVLFALSLVSTPLFAAQVQPEILFTNAHVFTMDPKRPWAGNMALSGGRIVALDVDESEIDPEETKVIDLSGRFVLPGFHDAHIHPIDSGVDFLECPLYDVKNVEGLTDVVKKCSKKLKRGEWLRGSGWTQSIFSAPSAPHFKILDQISKDYPIYLMCGDGHSVWVNSKALSLAKIEASTPDPRDGKIVRDEHGQPTGLLIEGAMELVNQVMPARSKELKMAGLKIAIDLAHRFGITSFHDAYMNREFLEIYRELDQKGGLKIEMSGALYADSNRPVDQIQDFIRLKKEFESERIRLKTVKIFMDGVFEDKTAALLEPYLIPDSAGEMGSIQWDLEKLHSLGRLALQNGFNLHFHAIGDRAVREALNTVQDATLFSGRKIPGHRIAHLQLIHPSDWKRFGELGVFANFQPLWACRDVSITRFTEPYIGEERSKYIYPIGGVLNAGGELAFGSDWSVTTLNPFEAIQTAITRQDTDGSTDPNWTPEQRISLMDALKGYTVGGARVEQRENDFGSIEVGKLGNFIVLDRDLLRTPVNEISNIKVLRTYQRGEEVYRAKKSRR